MKNEKSIERSEILSKVNFYIFFDLSIKQGRHGKSGYVSGCDIWFRL